MKDKEKANMSTKEEIERRNKTGKEKDELRQALLHYATAEASGGIKSLIDCEGCAFYLYEMLGYRKLPEDSVAVEKGLLEYWKDKATNINGLLLKIDGVNGWFPKEFIVKAIETYKSMKDSVVLSKEEFEKLKGRAEEVFNEMTERMKAEVKIAKRMGVVKGSKETAEKYYTLMNDCIKSNLNIRKNKNTFATALSRDNDELAKQFGVEIKE